MTEAVQTTTQQEELGAGLRVTWVGLVVNVLLIGLKFVGGILGGSQALIADAVHSVSDLFGDAVVLLGLKWGRKEADPDHPYGHGRIETIAALGVGLVLLFAAILIGYQAIANIYSHNVSQPGPIAIAVAAFAIASKEWMYWYTVKVGKQIRSTAVIANAWHHRSDALSSVAVLIGVLAAYLNPDWHIADAIAALLVSLFILRVALGMMRSSIAELVDEAPDAEILQELKERAVKIDGVLQVHDLKARHSGPFLLVEMHVVVDGDISVHEGHEIAEEVKARLLDGMDPVTDVLVHIEPDTELIEGEFEKEG